MPDVTHVVLDRTGETLGFNNGIMMCQSIPSTMGTGPRKGGMLGHTNAEYIRNEVNTRMESEMWTMMKK